MVHLLWPDFKGFRKRCDIEIAQFGFAQLRDDLLLGTLPQLKIVGQFFWGEPDLDSRGISFERCWRMRKKNSIPAL